MAELTPIVLEDNRVPVFYAGGRQINEFRRLDEPRDGPEDWVASVVTLPPALIGTGVDSSAGLSRLSDGRTLRALVEADPQGWLGGDLAAAFGGSTALLVKLLDAGERLPVHCHPTRPFAQRNLDSVFGKTEGWVVMRTQPGAAVWIGMNQDVSLTQMRRWIDQQDAPAMIEAMNRLPVEPGMVIYVPAGVPHAIGPGVMVTELQEPTSFSILAEHEIFGVSREDAALGVGWDLAVSCFDLGSYKDRLSVLAPTPRAVVTTPEGGVTSLFDRDADPYFRAWRISGSVTLPEAAFAVLVVDRGCGDLVWDGDRMPVVAGQTIVAPHAVGPLRCEGDLDVIACLPPDPAALR